MNEIKIYEKTVLCKHCGEHIEVVVFVDEEGNEEYQDICYNCSYELFINIERDNLREEISSKNITWSKLINELKKVNMDKKLGARQYAKLEPAQKIFNTLIMTLGSDWLMKNIENPQVLMRLVDLSVELSDRLVEKLYLEDLPDELN